MPHHGMESEEKMSNDQRENEQEDRRESTCLACGHQKAQGETITIVTHPGNNEEAICVSCAYPASD